MFEVVYHPLYGELNEIEQPKPFFEAYETPLRVKLTWNYLKKIGYSNRDFKDTNLIINSDKNLVFKQPKPLLKEDIALVHSNFLIELVEKLSEIGIGQLGNLVQATPDTFDIALLSAGGAYEAISNVFERKYSESFALIRPPGHHAIKDASDGLCVFNNIAIAIKKMRKDLEFKGKIAIIDIDTHYGDGLSKIFYEDPSVLYSSIHEFDYTVGEAGFFTEMGAKEGIGYNINFPIPFQSDDSYFVEYCNFLSPFIEKYSPEMIIVATGFDAHYSDPIGNLSFTSEGYRYFATWLKKISNKICGGRVSFCLEGGYNLLILPRLVETLISTFISVQLTPPIDIIQHKIFPKNISETEELSTDQDYLKESFKKKLIEFKKRLNRIW